MPLITRALIKLGNRCSLEAHTDITLGRARDIGLDLAQLDHSPPSKRPYLAGADSLQSLFLFHASSSSTTLNVFALITPTGKGHVYIIDPASNRQPLSGVQSTYATIWKDRATENILFEAPTSMELETSYHGNESTALKVISRDLSKFENKSYVMVIASNKDQAFYEYGITKLSRFPVMMMPGAKITHSLDTLMWQSHVLKKMIARYIFQGQWLHSMLQKATYF